MDIYRGHGYIKKMYIFDFEVKMMTGNLNLGVRQTRNICGNRIKAGLFNVIIQDIVVHATND